MGTTLSGRANFGFNSQYKKGATTPTGETEFQFQVGNFNFHSTSYQWLVVSGALAQCKGTGTVNGQGSYNFLLTAKDGQISGGGGTDGFRIKVTDSGGNTVFDNCGGHGRMTASNTEAISGGSIVIHPALNAAEGPDGAASVSTNSAPLTPQNMAPIVGEAIARWRAAGIDQAGLDALSHIQVQVTDLPASWAWPARSSSGSTRMPRAMVGSSIRPPRIAASSPASAPAMSSGHRRRPSLRPDGPPHRARTRDGPRHRTRARRRRRPDERGPGGRCAALPDPVSALTTVTPTLVAIVTPTTQPVSRVTVGDTTAPVVTAVGALPQPTGSVAFPVVRAARSQHRHDGRLGHVPAGSKHSTLIQAGPHEKAETSLTSARARNRLTSESLLNELALGKLQGRVRS